MRRCKRWGPILGLVLSAVLTSLIMIGCDSDDDGPFVLDDCRLNEVECRLQ